jgi:hypothetical protein
MSTKPELRFPKPSFTALLEHYKTDAETVHTCAILNPTEQADGINTCAARLSEALCLANALATDRAKIRAGTKKNDVYPLLGPYNYRLFGKPLQPRHRPRGPRPRRVPPAPLGPAEVVHQPGGRAARDPGQDRGALLHQDPGVLGAGSRRRLEQGQLRRQRLLELLEGVVLGARLIFSRVGR